MIGLLNHGAGTAPTSIGKEVEEGITSCRRAFVVRPVNEHGPANDKFTRHKTPTAAVLAIVAVVTHYEIGTGRNSGRLTVDAKMKVRINRGREALFGGATRPGTVVGRVRAATF